MLAGTRDRSFTSEYVVLSVWATAASVAPPPSFTNAAVCCYCSWAKAVSVVPLLSGVLVLEGAENNGYAERLVAVRCSGVLGRSPSSCSQRTHRTCCPL